MSRELFRKIFTSVLSCRCSSIFKAPKVRVAWVTRRGHRKEKNKKAPRLRDHCTISCWGLHQSSDGELHGGLRVTENEDLLDMCSPTRNELPDPRCTEVGPFTFFQIFLDMTGQTRNGNFS